MGRLLISIGSLPIFRLFRPSFRATSKRIRRFMGEREKSRLSLRWNKKPQQTYLQERSLSLENVAIVVINLVTRPDRLEEFKAEMARLEIFDFTVVKGVPGKELYPELPGDFSGAIGCNLAHSDAVEAIDWERHGVLMVCEDDVEFVVSRSELEDTIEEFFRNPYLDVLCIAGRVRGAKVRISERLFVATGIVGQACYLVKPHMASILADLWRSGVTDLSRKKLRGKNDIIWNKLQRAEAFFAFPAQRHARQRSSYSDIQGRVLPVQEST